jgi:hypothetical protein
MQSAQDWADVLVAFDLFRQGFNVRFGIFAPVVFLIIDGDSTDKHALRRPQLEAQNHHRCDG